MLLVTIEFAGEHEIERLRDQLEARFLTKVNVSRSDFDCRDFLDLHRNQYSSSAIIERLEQHLPAAASKVLAVTGLDLYIPVLTFVFGEAEMPGRAAIFSIYRLREEFYGLPPDRTLLTSRAVRELWHEAGHLRGLAHCADWNCVMSSSHSVERVDSKSERYCGECERKLRNGGR